MKKMKKLFSLVMALAMVMSLTVAANAAGETGTITITNAADGATYSFYKLFSAKVAAEKPEDHPTDGIAYTGDIPSELTDYFAKDGFGQITAKTGIDLAKMQADMLKWAKTQTATKTVPGAEAKAGVTVDYGYYVILSNVGAGTAVTVDSTNPNAEVIDKNTTTVPVWPKDAKKVNGDDVVFQMGTTATYTVTLKTVNWVPGATDDDPAVKVTEYTITDDFAGGKLTDVKVTSIQIGDETPITGDDAQFENGTITLPWVDAEGESLHEEGVNIVITYTATVNDTGKIENTVSATYKTNGNPIDIPDSPKADVYNSTIKVNKYDSADNTKKLPGAKFALTNADGKYYSITGNVVSWIDAPTDNSVPTNATVVTTDDNGYAEFRGLADGTYNLIETEAPQGYNKLLGTKSVPVTAANDGHVVEYTADVENSIGLELPSTGGIGTTIFTVVGGALMVGAAVLFITKKRSED